MKKRFKKGDVVYFHSLSGNGNEISEIHVKYMIVAEDKGEEVRGHGSGNTYGVDKDKVHKDILDALKQAEEEVKSTENRTKTSWKDAAVDPPKSRTRVLTFHKAYKNCNVEYYVDIEGSDGELIKGFSSGGKVEDYFWMPLPEPPEGTD